MIAIDPGEVFSSAVQEAFKRASYLIGSILIGSVFAFISAIGAETLLSLTSLAGNTFITPLLNASSVPLPLAFFDSGFTIVMIANALLVSFYAIRCEDPTPNRFIIHASIQLFCFTAVCNEWAFDPAYRWESIASAALLWYLAASFLALLIFCQFFFKNFQKCDHEKHLMGVAAENEAWRRRLENAEFIPAPPSGPKSPKARPLLAGKKEK